MFNKEPEEVKPDEAVLRKINEGVKNLIKNK